MDKMIKTWPTLYKRARTGQILQWIIQVAQGTFPIIDKWSGQLGSENLIHHSEQISVGVNLGKANETTPEQQALLQAESDWKKKKDSGYKSLKDLDLLVVGPTPEAYKNPSTRRIYDDILIPILEKVLPQFNSDAQGMPKPMLAKDWKKVKNIQYPCIIEPKLDGVRCLMIVRPDEGGEMPETLFLSRSGKEYTTLSHIARTIEDAMDDLPGEFILDGEIYSDELTFQEIVAAVKKTSPNSLKLHFRAYDILNEETQWDRRKTMDNLVSLIDSEYIVPINWSIANNDEHVKEIHDYHVQAGNEGAILRHYNGKYEQGFRSSNLLKVKEFNETEFEVVSLEYGQRGVEDLLAVCQLNDRVKHFKAKVEGSLAQKIKFEQEYQEAYETEKSSKLTVKHFGWTTDGLPRFPIGKTLRNYE